MNCRRRLDQCAGLWLAASLTTAASAQGLPQPTSWQWVTDVPAEHQTALSPAEGKWLFGVMAPGWHITTRPGAVLYEPAYVGRGRYSLEAETFLFPGNSQSGIGLVVGGRELGTAGASYTAFLIRRDGSVAVERRSAGRTTMVAEWRQAAGVVAGTAAGPARNVLRVEVEAEVTRLLVNDTVVAEVPRPLDEFAGTVGLRVGSDLDLHVTNLDLTLKLALPRPPK